MSPRRMIAFIPFLMAIAISMYFGATVLHSIKDPVELLSIPVLLYGLGMFGLGMAIIGFSANAEAEN